MSDQDESLVIDNSPVEFVIIGPRGDHDAVLVRTRDAMLDLIGFSWSGDEGLEGDKACLRTLVSPLLQSTEKRLLPFAFCVRAILDKEDFAKLKTELDQRINDIQAAVVEWDPVKLERAIAPLIYRCNKAHVANARLRRFRQTMRYALFGSYGVLFVAVMMFIMFEFIKRLLPLP